MTELHGSRRGQGIFLNGTSSAGKTPLAHAIQEASQQPYLLAGIDSF
jgi:chloramphenicol 3-O phosphotransferase